MRLGALIITTGLSPVSGVEVLLNPAGTITAGQRMISAFQTAGVNTINTYDILNADKLVIVKDAVAKIEEVYA